MAPGLSPGFLGFPVQRLQIFVKEKSQDNLIVDLKIKVGGLNPGPALEGGEAFKDSSFLVLEWLTLQNPLLGVYFQEAGPAGPGPARPQFGQEGHGHFLLPGTLDAPGRLDGLSGIFS